MGKRFCAKCHLEKHSLSPFGFDGCSTEFCKQCAEPTASYWADEPRTSVIIEFRRPIKKELENRDQQLVEKLHNAKHITGEIKEEEKTIYVKPLEEIIKEEWKTNAGKRAWIAENWRKLKAEREREEQKNKKRKKVRDMTFHI